jgi:hypothetical protein
MRITPVQSGKKRNQKKLRHTPQSVAQICSRVEQYKIEAVTRGEEGEEEESGDALSPQGRK